MSDATESLGTVVAPRCPFPAGHGPLSTPQDLGIVQAPLGDEPRSPFRSAMGDELGRKAALGLLFLGSGALVVAGLAVAGWLFLRLVRVKMAERRERRRPPELGVREVVSSPNIRAEARAPRTPTEER